MHRATQRPGEEPTPERAPGGYILIDRGIDWITVLNILELYIINMAIEAQ